MRCLNKVLTIIVIILISGVNARSGENPFCDFLNQVEHVYCPTTTTIIPEPEYCGEITDIELIELLEPIFEGDYFNHDIKIFWDHDYKLISLDSLRGFLDLNKLSKLSASIFSGIGDMFHYTPGSINTTYYWPIDIHFDNGNKYRPVYPDPEGNKPLRIVHASNHRIFKGTDYLIKAVNELKNEKIDIELVLVEKVPNDNALNIYRSADIIFDQCLMGNYGYFALEGMALGKPVMCYIRKPEEYLLHPEECPLIHTHVNTLKEDIRNLAKNREQLKEIGIRGRQYIEKYFTLESFASRLGKIYKELQIIP